MCTTIQVGLGTRVEDGVLAAAGWLADAWRRLTGALLGDRPAAGVHAAAAGASEAGRAVAGPDVRVATAAILLEVAESRHAAGPEARRVAECTMREEYGLSGWQANRLVREADEARRASPGIWTFTSVLVASVSAAQRRRLTELVELVGGTAEARDGRRRYAAARIRWLLRVEGARV